jgi:hypothetical protein
MPASSGKTAGKEGDASSPARVSQADLAADAPSEYTVVKGDTLWGIAGRFLKDPWKWPLIWQMNQEQVKNPHLIYPGDVIKLDREALKLSLASSGGSGGGGGGADSGPSGGTSAQAMANVIVVQPRARTEALQSAVPSIPGTVIGPFLTQPLVVEENSLAMAPTVLATQESRVIVGAGDTAYADRIGSADGVNWQVFRQGQPLHDPETNELLGYEAKYVGDARVRKFGNPTTIEIVKTRAEINKGDRLAPAREAAFPTYMPRAPDKPIKGVIMSVDGGVSEFGQYSVITINRGARDGVEVGHVLASSRRGEPIAGPSRRDIDFFSGTYGYGIFGTPAPSTQSPGETGGAPASSGPMMLPEERNGLVFVFRVFDKLSYALVMRSTRPIYVGDVVATP